MLFRTLVFSLFCSFFLPLSGQDLPFIESFPDEIVAIEGNVAEGIIMEDLSWAWSGSNACFTMTQSRKFRGLHVLYATELQAYTEMEITLIPDDPEANFSLYAYQVGLHRTEAVPPNLVRCIRCEADYKWDRPYRGRTQDHRRIVKDLLSARNPYRVVIGVVGPEGWEEAGYTLEIALLTR